MKIQELAIIFILIILPFSIVLSAYTSQQMKIINLQTQYDSKLTSATYDAIKAFKINTTSNTESDLSNSKIRDIEASVQTFKNSMAMNFGIVGYDDTALNSYIPALVYTMYDGYYIYSPYTNTNNLGIDRDEETIYGLKPYIYYSCRYQRGNDDFVITYALDNYIQIQGTINGNYVSDAGYLIDGITMNSVGELFYKGIVIDAENALTEYVGDAEYKYIKLNGTKYYWNEEEELIFYLLNGKITVQAKKANNEDEYKKYTDVINANTSALQYYTDAYEFTKRLREEYELSTLRFENAIEVDKNGNKISIFPNDDRFIFKKDDKISIEYSNSNFTQHRLAVIRKSVETNLSVAIANYNKYSSAITDFQMPKLKEDEWDLILNNVSMISFIQGLNAGGKIYNGYSIVINSETQEVIQESSIYIIGTDGYYHSVADVWLYKDDTTIGNEFIKSTYSKGRTKLDFNLKEIQQVSDAGLVFETQYYPRREKASYNSIINQTGTTTYNSVYEYLESIGTTTATTILKKTYYTALGRERWGMYKTSVKDIVSTIEDQGGVPPVKPDPKQEEEKNGDETKLTFGEGENTITIIARPYDMWTNQNVSIKIEYGDGIFLDTVQLGISGWNEKDGIYKGIDLAKNRIEKPNENYIYNLGETNFYSIYKFNSLDKENRIQQDEFIKAGYLVVKAYDKTGNEIIASITIDKIERTPPKGVNGENQLKFEGVSTDTNTATLRLNVIDPYYDDRGERTSGIDKIVWYYKLKAETNWKSSITENILDTGGMPIEVKGEITGLIAGEEYDVYGIVYDKAGNSIRTDDANFEMKEVPPADGRIEFSEPIWDAKNKATVTITKIINEETNDLQIQYQVVEDGETLQQSWITASKGDTATKLFNLNDKSTIYARLWDGINGGKYATLKLECKKLLAVVASVGDYVDYKAGKYSYKSKTGSGKDVGNGSQDQTFESNDNIKWRVLKADKESKEVILISETPIKTNLGYNYSLSGAIGYLYAENELNNICSIYGHGAHASSARSIYADLINEIISYSPNLDNKAYTHKIYYPTTETVSGKTETAKERTDKTTSYYGTTNTINNAYKVLFGENSNFSYWISSNSTVAYSPITYFNVGVVKNAMQRYEILAYGREKAIEEYSYSYGIRPIVILEKDTYVMPSQFNGTWKMLY